MKNNSWLDLFNATFSNYYEGFKVPMYSSYNYGEDKLNIKVAIPGYEKEALSLSVEEDDLNLNVRTESGLKTYRLMSRNWDVRYDIESAKVKYLNGMLTIEIPKDQKTKAKKVIEIS